MVNSTTQNQQVDAATLKHMLLLEALTTISNDPTATENAQKLAQLLKSELAGEFAASDVSALVPIPLEKLMAMLTATTAATAATVTQDEKREAEYWQSLIGKTVFFRGGIFAYIFRVVDVTKDAVIADRVCWLADAGDLNKLLSLKTGDSLTGLNPVKTQYYKPNARVLFMKSLLSDISEWEGSY